MILMDSLDASFLDAFALYDITETVFTLCSSLSGEWYFLTYCAAT